MPGIGDTLREARMRQRIDITDVEAATKIRAKYLRALENEEFDLIHGPTFVRSFLRTYAQYLGLDAQRLLEEYRTRYAPRDELELHPHIAPLPPRGRDRRRRPRQVGPGAVIAGGVVAVLAFLLVLGLTGDEGGEGGGGERPGGTTETAERTDSARERAERRAARRRARARERRRRAAAPRSVRLRIDPAEPTYVCLDRGPGTGVLFEGTLDGARTFSGRRLRLNLGRTSARVRVNGRRVNVGAGSDPVGWDFTPRRRTAIPTGRRPCS
jgi:cytoskeleton protein RodZ